MKFIKRLFCKHDRSIKVEKCFPVIVDTNYGFYNIFVFCGKCCKYLEWRIRYFSEVDKL